MLIFKPRASRMAPKEADAMPLPSEETTPPVTKTNRVMMGHRRLMFAGRDEYSRDYVHSQREQLEFDGSSGYQKRLAATINFKPVPARPPIRTRDRVRQRGRTSARPATDHRPQSAHRLRTPWAAHHASRAARPT